MSRQEKYEDDLLKRFIKPEGIEKAPEGFTTKVMAQIQTEKIVVRRSTIHAKRTYIPYVSAAFAVLFTLIVVLLPGSESKPLSLPALDFINSIKITMPEFDFGSLFSLSVPSALIYGFIGILLLTFLDKALSGVFHRENKNS